MASSPREESPRWLTRGRVFGLDAISASICVVGIALIGRGVVGVAVLALALLGVALQWAMRRPELQWTPLGDGLVVRALLAAGTAVALAELGPPLGGQVLMAAVAAAGLITALAVESLLARVARFTVPVVANLPGVPATPPSRDLSRSAAYASGIATAVGLVLAALGGSALWWLVAVVAALVPYLVLALDGRAKIVAARRQRVKLPAAVRAYAPEFVIHTSRPDDASYQVMMWLPHLKRAGRPFLIVTRHAEPARALAKLTDVPIVEARQTVDLEALLVPSLQAALYPNASSGNGTLARYQHLTHIYLGHGDSDKPPSYNPTHAMYDRIFAAGPAAVRRYAAHGVHLPAEKFQIVGRPQVEEVQQALGPIADATEPVVLYAPTWRGHVEETLLYSLPEGERIVRSLLDHGATVIFRPHPFTADFADDARAVERIHRVLADDARSTGRRHLWGPAAESERSIVDVINASDAMISDVSSVASDFLFSGKPFAMVAVPEEPDRFVAAYPVARASYVIRGDLADLDAAIEQMLGPDPLRAERLAVRKDYLGDFPTEGYSDAFVDAVRELTGKGSTDVEGEEPAGAEVRRFGNYGRAFAFDALDLASTLLATGALASALLGASPILMIVLVWMTIVAAMPSTVRMLRDRRSWPKILAEAQVSRAVALVALATVALESRAGLGVWIGLVLLTLVLALERQIRSAWGVLGLEAAGLPLIKVDVPEVLPRIVVPLVGFAAVAVGVVLLHLPYADLTMVLLGALGFAVGVDAAVRSLIRARRVVAAEEGLRPALEAYAPQFAVYFASDVGAAYQVGMWLPYFTRIGTRFLVITRTVPMMREVTDLTRAAGVDVPVLYRPTLRSLEEVLVPSLSAAFYVNNAVRNTHFIERRELTHVWLNHGDSEKPACYNPVHAIYDTIFSAGQAGIDRYARHGVAIPREKFQIVGRPQVEGIEPARAPIAAVADPVVLYAPTWQGPFADSRVYSLPQGAEIVRRLLERGLTVVFRPHPFNRRYPQCAKLIAEIEQLLSANRAATGRPHRWGSIAEQEMSVEDCFNVSDAMICDVSAVVSDYLRSDKPFSIVSVGRSPQQLLAEAPAARAAYVLREDLANADEVLDDLLRNDPLASVRDVTRRYYLGDFDQDHYADGFLAAARAVIAATTGASEGQNREAADAEALPSAVVSHSIGHGANR